MDISCILILIRQFFKGSRCESDMQLNKWRLESTLKSTEISAPLRNNLQRENNAYEYFYILSRIDGFPLIKI